MRIRGTRKNNFWYATVSTQLILRLWNESLRSFSFVQNFSWRTLLTANFSSFVIWWEARTRLTLYNLEQIFAHIWLSRSCFSYIWATRIRAAQDFFQFNIYIICLHLYSIPVYCYAACNHCRIEQEHWIIEGWLTNLKRRATHPDSFMTTVVLGGNFLYQAVSVGEFTTFLV